MVESGAGAPAEWFCEQQPERRFAVGFAGGLPLAGQSIGDVLRWPVLAKELCPPCAAAGSNSGWYHEGFYSFSSQQWDEGLFYWVF
jgi:hypothetical protein